MFPKEMSNSKRAVCIGGMLMIAVAAGWGLEQLAAQAKPVDCKGAAAAENRAGCSKSFQQKSFSPSLKNLPKPQRGALRNRQECSGGLKNEKEIKQICYLGSPKSKASQTIGLIGDSHAAQWRPAMRIIAKQEKLRIASVSASACNYRIPKGADQDKSDCGQWRRQVPKWLSAHPEIDTVIFSQVASGGKEARAEVQAGWNRLPESVKKTIILRDSPRNNPQLNKCVARAQQNNRAPGPACATPRSKALPPDPAVSQAKQTGRPVIDMSDSFCDSKKCYTVLGGILVYADGNHQTPQFNRTTAPYLKAKLLPLLGQ